MVTGENCYLVIRTNRFLYESTGEAILHKTTEQQQKSVVETTISARCCAGTSNTKHCITSATLKGRSSHSVWSRTIATQHVASLAPHLRKFQALRSSKSLGGGDSAGVRVPRASCACKRTLSQVHLPAPKQCTRIPLRAEAQGYEIQ